MINYQAITLKLRGFFPLKASGFFSRSFLWLFSFGWFVRGIDDANCGMLIVPLPSCDDDPKWLKHQLPQKRKRGADLIFWLYETTMSSAV